MLLSASPVEVIPKKELGSWVMRMMNGLVRRTNQNYCRTLLLALLASVFGDLAVGQSSPSAHSRLGDSIDVQSLLKNAKRPHSRIALLPVSPNASAFGSDQRDVSESGILSPEPIPILPTSPTGTNDLLLPTKPPSLIPLEDSPQARIASEGLVTDFAQANSF
jgi:hypothetical protein